MRQQSILLDLEAQVEAYESADLYVENKALKSQVEQLSESNNNLTTQISQVRNHNAQLTRALYDYADRERRSFVDDSKARLEIYFGRHTVKEADNLSVLETELRSRADVLIESMNRHGVETSHPLHSKIASFKQESALAIQDAKEKIAAAREFMAYENNEAYDKLQTEPLTREQIIALAKRYSRERFVGLNLISTIGILLLIIAAIFAGQFTVARMTDAQRAVAIFAFGGALLCVGEYFNRRKASVLSLVVAAGGIAILYVALAFSYFALGLLGMVSALVICVAITGVAFVFSTRYRAQILLVLAFAGGHMPFFAIVLDVSFIYGLMVYFVILNLLLLLVSFRFKWTVATFIGLGFNIIAVWGVFFLGTASDAGTSYFVLIGYIFLSFLVYTAIPIVGTFAAKGRFAFEDNVLIAINTFVSCVTMYVAFGVFGWDGFMGLLALIFAVFYFGLALVLWKKFSEADMVRDIAALTGIVFFILIIPFQFDVVWLSLGWLLQGVALAVYGIIKGVRRVKYAGLVIFVLCVAAFLLVDVVGHFWAAEGFYFGFRYLSVTVGSFLIWGAFVFKKTVFTNAHKAYQTLVLTNVWIYLVYMASHLSDRLTWAYPLSAFYLMMVVQAMLAWVLAYAFSRIKILFTGGTAFLVFVLYVIGLVGFFILNMSGGFVPYTIGVGSVGVTVGATTVIVAVSGLSIFSLYDMLRYFVVWGGMKHRYVHVVISVYALVIVTQNVIVHYGVAFTNIWLSVFYVLTALGWIIYGFVRGHMQLRRNGLGLALISVAKVFLLDLTGLSLEQRIVSFLIMGGLLVGIGYLYQYFSKKLEVRLELAGDGESEGEGEKES